MKWKDGKRIIVHICDAPAHRKKYSKDSNDNHKLRNLKQNQMIYWKNVQKKILK